MEHARPVISFIFYLSPINNQPQTQSAIFIQLIGLLCRCILIFFLENLRIFGVRTHETHKLSPTGKSDDQGSFLTCCHGELHYLRSTDKGF